MLCVLTKEAAFLPHLFVSWALRGQRMYVSGVGVWCFTDVLRPCLDGEGVVYHLAEIITVLTRYRPILRN